jgi:DNA-binding CsgD family transcriptional regulator
LLTQAPHDCTECCVRVRANSERGAALRRAGRPLEAREPLRLAVDLAHRCGATTLEEHALAELRATGAKPRRPLLNGAGALTRSEHRIAELAAAGRLNREIADELFVTLATVEFHLRNAYRKLGIASRGGLGEALGMQRGGPRRAFNVGFHGGSVAALHATSNSSTTAPSPAFARSVSRSRSVPPPETPYSRWEGRSSTMTATL